MTSRQLRLVLLVAGGAREPIESTVLVDAQTRRIVRVFDHDDPEADDALRKVFPPRK